VTQGQFKDQTHLLLSSLPAGIVHWVILDLGGSVLGGVVCFLGPKPCEGTGRNKWIVHVNEHIC